MNKFAIKSFSNAPYTKPEDIKATTYVKHTHRVAGYEGLLMLVDDHQNDEPSVYCTFPRGHYGDVREAKRPVRDAWCRLTGMTRKELDKAIREYKEAEKVKNREDNIDALLRHADRIGVTISIEE